MKELGKTSDKKVDFSWTLWIELELNWRKEWYSVLLEKSFPYETFVFETWTMYSSKILFPLAREVYLENTKSP